MDPFIQKLANKYEVVILPRSNTQRNHFLQIKFNEVQVSEKMISLQEIKKSCIVFIVVFVCIFM
jgi:DNA-binding HxlR family transcriptional regulator